MKKNDNSKEYRKKGKLPKDFVPQSKNAIREMIPFKIPNEFSRSFKNEFEPFDHFPEWPGDEEAKNFDFSQVDNSNDNSYLRSIDNYFFDPKNEEIHLPDSIMFQCQGTIKWLRPDKWIRDFMVDKEIRRAHPNKNPIKFRSKIREVHREMQIHNHENTEEMEENVSIDKMQMSPKKQQNDFLNLNMNEVSMEDMKFRKDYADLINLYEMNLENKVVFYTIQNIENTEPDNKPVVLKTTKMNQDKNVSHVSHQTENNVTYKQLKHIAPGDICFDETLPYFCKWMSSLMQSIKDLDILKLDSIIYPQKDGIPIYNPVGRYWLKLFHMGKYRKIEIDDRIPCTKFDEFFFPHCENVEEIWPALITKGILKLFSYRYNRIKYKQENILQEKGDISILYSLTGYIPEHLNINYIQEDKFENLANLLNDTRYLNRQKYFLCYNNYALESTSKKLDHKLNYKNRYGESVNGISLHKTNQIMNQPFMGINIFKNYFSKMRHDNSSFDQNQGVFSDGSPEKDYENNENDNAPLEGSNKKKASMKISMGDAKRLAKMRAKQKSNQGIFNEEGNFRIPEDLEIEKAMNKLNPIAFKDDAFMLDNEREYVHKVVRQSLLLKEKTNKISSYILNNLQNLTYFIESKQLPMEQKHLINQITKINDINQRGIKINNENNKLFYEKKTKNIFSDIIYSVSDLFYSGDEFNMKRLQPVDFTDLKQKILAAQTNFKLLSAQEKKNYITNIKELKIKHKEEKKSRLMELNKPGEKIFLVKVQHGLKKIMSTLIEDYSNEEVLMAKKCLINNWKFPPAAYFEKSFSKYDLAAPSNKKGEGGHTETHDEHKIPNSIKMMNTSWTKDFYVKMVKNIGDDNLNISHMNDKRIQQTELDFYNNPKEIIERQKGGIWINWSSFLSIFKGFVILHNPSNYTSIVNVDANWYNYKTDVYASEKFTFFFTSNINNINKSFLANVYEEKDMNNARDVKKDPINIKDQKRDSKGNPNPNQGQLTNSHSKILNLKLANLNGSNSIIHQSLNLDNVFDNNFLPNTKFFNHLSNSCINIVFEPNYSNSYLLSDMTFFIIFDLISFSGRKLFSNIKLSGNFSTYQFDEIIFEQDYYLVITGGLHPFGYNLRILSDHFVETLTYFNYMRRLNNLVSFPVPVSYPNLEKNRIFLLAKIKIDTRENANMIFNLKQNENNIDNNLKNYFEFFLIQNDSEKKINSNKMNDIAGSEEPYYMNVTITPPYNLPEGNFELEFLSNNADMKIDIVDLVEPYEISDKFTINRHGIIMKEQVHIPEMLSCSLDIEFKKKIRAKSPKSNSSKETEFKPIEKSIRLILEITKEDRIVYTTQFFTKTFINHLELNFIKQSNSNLPTEINEKDKDKKKKNDNQSKSPYNMLLKLDLSEAPKEFQIDNEDVENDYFWFVRFFSTENIALMKDTSKEERESSLKEGWEIKNAGRAEKAKNSRKKYLLIAKKNRGEPLTQEEEVLLNEIRNRTYLTNLEDKKNKGGKDDGKSKDKKIDDGKSETSKISKEKSKINPLNDHNLSSKGQYLKQSFYQRMNKTKMLPKPENHSALYLKNFLSYAYRDRVMHSEHKISKFCLDEDKVKDINFLIDNKVEDYYTQRNRESLKFEEKKKKMIDETKTLNEKNINRRRLYSGKIVDLMNSRDQIMDKIDNLIDVQKKLKDVVNGYYDLDRTIVIYKETISDNNLNMKFEGLCNDIFNYISERKDEIYRAEIKKFTPKDNQGIKKIKDDLNANNWNISEEVKKLLNELEK